MALSLLTACLVTTALAAVTARFDQTGPWSDGSDLSLFVTVCFPPSPVSVRDARIPTGHCLTCRLTFHQRPEIRAPKYQFKYHDRDAATPGYIFVAPYADMAIAGTRPEFQPCQVGPHIYDMDGVSVYPGSSLRHGLT